VVDLDEIFLGGDNVEYYLDFLLFNPVAPTAPKLRTFKLLRWVQLLNRLVDLDEMLYGGDDIKITSMPYFLIPYLKPFQNGGRLNF
jgi:hypothetical protein